MLDNGYEMQTTFWSDFSIADRFGKSAVLDTYKRAFKEWKKDIVYVTELAMVLNWKIYEHYGKNNELAELYDKLWRELDEWIIYNHSKANVDYYLKVTD